MPPKIPKIAVEAPILGAFIGAKHTANMLPTIPLTINKPSIVHHLMNPSNKDPQINKLSVLNNQCKNVRCKKIGVMSLQSS